MEARLPIGVSASALFHAGVVMLLVVLPLLGKAPLPEPIAGKVTVVPLPAGPPRPATPNPVRPRGAAPRRPATATVVVPVAQIVPAVAPSEAEPLEDPSDSTMP